MPKITYTFSGAPYVKVTQRFENNTTGLIDASGKGSVEIPIVSDLDIKIRVKGTELSNWSLNVLVDGAPILKPAKNGFIEGKTDIEGNGFSDKKYKWRVK